MLKYLYDKEAERNQIILTQSVILMSLWYPNGVSVGLGAWHWVGIAISMSQSQGMHRDAQQDFQRVHQGISRQRLFRRIWWACFLRDRWLSIATGYPMRIHLEDCDVSMPSVEDVTLELNGLPASITDKYLPEGRLSLACLWIKLVRLSMVLGILIRTFYGLNRLEPINTDIARYEDQIQHINHVIEYAENDDELVLLSEYQYQLFYELVATFHASTAAKAVS